MLRHAGKILMLHYVRKLPMLRHPGKIPTLQHVGKIPRLRHDGNITLWLLPQDHNVDEEGGGAAAATPAAAAHIHRGREQGANSFEKELPVVQQEVGLFELAAVVLDVGARIHAVVNFDESLAPLLLCNLHEDGNHVCHRNIKGPDVTGKSKDGMPRDYHKTRFYGDATEDQFSRKCYKKNQLIMRYQRTKCQGKNWRAVGKGNYQEQESRENGMTFNVTGILEQISREQAEQVSKKEHRTTYQEDNTHD